MRLRVPDEGATVVHDVIRGDTRFEHVHLDDPVIARADGSVLYNFAVAIDDLDEAHHARRARRGPPLQHPQAAARAGGGARRRDRAERRCRSTPTCRCCTARRQEALQAPWRGLGAGAARRRLPARGGPQLPRAARLGRGRRRDGALDRRADGALHARARQPQPGALRRDKLRWLNGVYIRALPRRRADAARLESAVHGARESASNARRRSARRRSRRSPTSGRWRGSSSTARPTMRRRGALARRATGVACWRKRASARGARAVREAGVQEALRAVVSARASSRGRSTSRCAWRSPARRSRRAYSRAWRCSGATRRCGGSRPRSSWRAERRPAAPPRPRAENGAGWVDRKIT